MAARRASTGETGPPSQARLEDSKADLREVFQELRAFVKAEQKQRGSLEVHGKSLELQHRRSIFTFLSTLPERKPIFKAQAREVLTTLAEFSEWRDGGAVDEDMLAVASAPAAPSAPVAPRGGARKPVKGLEPSLTEEISPPPLLPPVEELEEMPPDVLDGFPPAEAFAEKSRHDAGDTFKDLRRWARRLAVWDLAAAGNRLDAAVRRDVFQFLTRMCERKLYSAQGRELISMFLGVDEWVADDVVDAVAVSRALDATPAKPLEPPQKPRLASKSPGPGRRASADRERPVRPVPEPTPEPAPQPPPKPAPQPQPSPYPPTRPAPDARRHTTPPAAAKAAPAAAKKPGERLAGRVEAALRAGAAGAGGLGAKDLVSLYKDAGLGGQASFSAEATDQTALRLLLGVAGQRLRDLYTDDLQHATGRAKVHIPHLYIDLQRRDAYNLPDAVKQSVEVKIRSLKRWTCIEKAHVLAARHEQTIRYVLAYALSQAKATGRSGAVWIPLGMNTGAQGHANAVCLQYDGAGGKAKAWIYDPNFSPSQSHWVHSQKAISDALPGVKRLLEGTGVSVPERAELFGNGLQTALGTTERHQGWFSSKVTITTRGYPICGAVVHLLAMIWVNVSGSGTLESLSDVEASIAEFVAKGEEGKIIVQQCVAALLRRLISRLDGASEDSFAKSMRHRMDEDKKEWPPDILRGGGSITVTGAKGRSLKYSW